MPKTVKANQTEAAKYPTILFLLAGIIIFGFGVWLGWNKIYNNPKRVFWAMLDNSLSTSSVTRYSSQGDDDNRLEQWVSAYLGGDNHILATTVVKQGREGSNEVVTETIGTPNEDFIRYSQIKTDQKTQGGAPIDFNGILGVWGKQAVQTEESGEKGGFFRETFLGSAAVPFANLPKPERAKLLSFLRNRNVYKSDYSKAVKQTKNDRSVYVYQVELQIGDYIQFLKDYAKAMGLGDLPSYDPTAYADAPPVQLELTVDILSRQLLEASYVAEGRSEQFSSYGAVSRVRLPTEAIAIEELQTRIQNVRQ